MTYSYWASPCPQSNAGILDRTPSFTRLNFELWRSDVQWLHIRLAPLITPIAGPPNKIVCCQLRESRYRSGRGGGSLVDDNYRRAMYHYVKTWCHPREGSKYNVLRCRQRKTEPLPWPRVTYRPTENAVKFGHVVCEICQRTDKHTDRQRDRHTYRHADRNTS